MNKRTLAFILIWLTTLIWGFGYIGVEDAINGGWGPFPIIFMRFLIASLVLLPFSLKHKWWHNKKLMIDAVINGIFLFFAYICQTIGQSLTSIANTSFLTVLWVVFIPLFLFIITKERLEIKNYIAVVLAVIGAFILCFENGIQNVNIGDILVIGGAIFFAIQIIHLDRIVEKHNFLDVTFVQMSSVSVLAFIFIVFTSSWNGFGSGGYIGLIYVAVFSSAIAFLFQAYGQKHLPPTTVALIFSLESVVATVGAALIFQEPITDKVILGGLLMLIATIIVQINFKRRPKKSKDLSK